MNNYIASEVIKELDDLGYTGSAADINPQITISGIVGNITGKKDLSRDAVPDRSNPLKTTTQTTHPVPMTMPTRTPPLPTRTVTRSGLS